MSYSDALSLTLPKAASRSKKRKRKRPPFGPRERKALFWCCWCVVWIAYDVRSCLIGLDHHSVVLTTLGFFFACFQFYCFKYWWRILRDWWKSDSDEDE